MTRYISKPENLKLMMNLLRDKSPNIQFEAFHVFKVKNITLINKYLLVSQKVFDARQAVVSISAPGILCIR